jgi:rRNA processing protein Krr1/Pno1
VLRGAGALTPGRDRDDDIAFVLGKGGVTKQKLARVSGARLEIDEKNYTLTIIGGPETRRKAQEYIDMVLAQR